MVFSVFQGGAKQCDGVHWLTQIVAGGGQEAGLFGAGSFGCSDLLAQASGQGLVLEAQDQRFGQPPVLLQAGAKGEYQIDNSESGEEPVQGAAMPDQGRDETRHHGNAIPEHGRLQRPSSACSA